MGWVETLSNVGLICLFIVVSFDFVLIMIANHHPKYSKNKLLYEKLMLPVDISIFFIITFPMLPIFFTNDIPINIKLGLIVLYSGAMGFGVWAVRHQYHKYKNLMKKALKSPAEGIEKGKT